jgi:predicted Rossmann-fold nucleotide-binding protein
VITLVQCKKAKPVPIVLYGSDYWKRLINLDVLVEEGTISPEDLQLFEYVDDPQSAWDAIVRFYGLPAVAC